MFAIPRHPNSIHGVNTRRTGNPITDVYTLSGEMGWIANEILVLFESLDAEIETFGMVVDFILVAAVTLDKNKSIYIQIINISIRKLLFIGQW